MAKKSSAVGPSLADQLKQFAIESGHSQRELARLTGINQGQLNLFFNGKKSISLEAAGRLANVLGLKLVKAKLRRVD